LANYQNIMRLRPEVRQFIRNRRWVHRGDTIFYGPNIRCDGFSTDAGGFRHSTFKGESLGVVECTQRDRYGLVLGPSSVYGFGLAGNENTMPSLLAERFGFPFANIGLPEGNSRNLFAILLGIIARAKHPPSAVVHISGGDFTNFCYTAIADPMFGSPNLKQIKTVLEERGGRPRAEQQMPALLAFTTLWIRAIAELCRGNKIPIVLADDTTFFEKARPTKVERESELGKPFNGAQTQQFETHKRFVADYHSRRKAVAENLGVPLAGPGITNTLGFIDEFHYDAGGTRALVDDFAKGLEPLLK
jgi:hypothetical protein